MADSGDVPEPSGPPEPVLDSGEAGSAGDTGVSLGEVLMRTGELGLVIAVAGGAALFVAGAFMSRPTMGATRSAQLTWQQRQAAVERAVAEQQDPGAADAAGPARGVQ
jgi:hypothetical protein